MRYLWILIVVFLAGCTPAESESPMKIIEPITIDESVLDSSSIAIDADGYGEWDGDFKHPELIYVGHMGQSGDTSDILSIYEHEEGTLTKLSLSDVLDEKPFVGSFELPYVYSVTVSKDRSYKLIVTYSFPVAKDVSTLYKRSTGNKWVRQDFAKNYKFCQFIGDYLFCGLTTHPWLHIYKWPGGMRKIEPPQNLPYYPIAYTWTPDNNTIFVLVGNDPPLWVLTREGDNFHATEYDLFQGEGPMSGQTIHLLPTNNRQLAVLTRPDGRHLTVLSVDGFELEQVYQETEKNIIAARYSPNGQYLAVGHIEEPYLSVLKRSGTDYSSTPISISHYPPFYAYQIAWSRDSKYLFIVFPSAPYLWVYERDGDAFNKLSNPAVIPPGNTYTIEYIPSTGYYQGDIVYKGNDLYESIIHDNRGNNPDMKAPESPVWLDLGKINRWRMFDEYLSTYSEAEDFIEVVLTPGEVGVDRVALFEIEAETVTVERVGSGWETTVTLDGKTEIVIELDQAMTLGESVRVRVDDLGKTVKVGKLVLGISDTLAQTLWDVESGIADYSKRQIDEWGRAYLKQGNWAKLINATGLVASDDLDDVYRTLVKYRSTPVVWDFNGDNTDYATLVAYGIYRDSRIVLHGPNYKKLRIDILGLI